MLSKTITMLLIAEMMKCFQLYNFMFELIFLCLRRVLFCYGVICILCDNITEKHKKLW